MCGTTLLFQKYLLRHPRLSVCGGSGSDFKINPKSTQYLEREYRLEYLFVKNEIMSENVVFNRW